MTIYDFTSSIEFNAIFSIYVHLSIVLASAFAVISLLRN